jgi:hypothetical protein
MHPRHDDGAPPGRPADDLIDGAPSMAQHVGMSTLTLESDAHVVRAFPACIKAGVALLCTARSDVHDPTPALPS